MKLHAPAAERNKAPILQVLHRILPQSGHLLEVASGTGQHIASFATAMPSWRFSPSDVDDASIASIDAWVRGANLSNVSPAVKLDASTWPWPIVEADAVYACNMVHISPWHATLGLLRGAGKVLQESGTLVLYGPFVIDGQAAESNIRFSQSLKRQNPEWGVRELRDLEKCAEVAELSLDQVVPMPANNHCVVFRKRQSS